MTQNIVGSAENADFIANQFDEVAEGLSMAIEGLHKALAAIESEGDDANKVKIQRVTNVIGLVAVGYGSVLGFSGAWEDLASARE